MQAFGQPASSKKEVMGIMTLMDAWREFICVLSRSVPGEI